jgi:hypothetical protein
MVIHSEGRGSLLHESLALQVLVRFAVVHIALLVFEFLGRLGVRQLGPSFLLELLGDCSCARARASANRAKTRGEREREEREEVLKKEKNVRAMASSILVIS